MFRNDNVCVSLWYKSPGKHLFVASKRGWYKSSGNNFDLKCGDTSTVDLVKTRILASATTCVVEVPTLAKIVCPAGRAPLKRNLRGAQKMDHSELRKATLRFGQMSQISEAQEGTGDIVSE